MSSNIGLTEKNNDLKFLDRIYNQEKIYKNHINCAETNKNSQWAELRSSYLVQKILMTQVVEPHLFNFVTNIINNIFKIRGEYIPLEQEFKDFIYNPKQLEQKNPWNDYPVSQSTAFFEKYQKAQQNVLILYNFIKYEVYLSEWAVDKIPLWDDKGCSWEFLNQFIILKLFQLQIFSIQWWLKGPRHNYPETTTGGSRQVGLGPIGSDKLLRRLTEFSKYKTFPWFHPANQQCRIPYFGKWGENLKNLKEQNDFYASTACGLSGSANFTLWSFLISHATTPIIRPQNERNNIILLAITVLVGDGGHNVREILYSLIISIIILRVVYNEITKELQKIFDNKDNLSENAERFDKWAIITIDELSIIQNTFVLRCLWNKLSSILHITKIKCNTSGKFVDLQAPFILLKLVINAFKNWSEFLENFYIFTKDINVVGVDKNDLDNYNSDILKKPKEIWEEYKTSLLHWFFNDGDKDPYQIFSTNQNFPTQHEELIYFNNKIQVFLALENDRYKHDNWKTSANEKLEEIILQYRGGDRLLRKIDKNMNLKLDECNKSEFKGKIPFAFPSGKNK